MAFLGAMGSLLLIVIPAFVGVLFGTRFLVSLFPGSLPVPLRRRLFLLKQPWIEPMEDFLPLGNGRADWAALALALICLFLVRALAPWMLLAGFGLAGG